MIQHSRISGIFGGIMLSLSSGSTMHYRRTRLTWVILFTCVFFILCVTQWPFNFWQPNGVSRLSEGGIRFSPPATAFAATPPEKLTRLKGFTVLAHLAAERSSSAGYAVIAGSAVDFLRENFVLVQWHDHVGFKMNSSDGKRVEQIWVPGVFSSFGSRWIAVVYGGETLSIFVNGEKKGDRAVGGFDCSRWDASYPFVLGSEGNGSLSWEGVMYSLELYDRPLSGDELRKPETVQAIHTPVVSYSFPPVSESPRSSSGLIIPERFRPVKKTSFLETYLYWLKGRLYARDILLNILLFLPLGFTVSAICQQLNFRSLNAFFTSLSAGFLLSLAVELLQLYLPDRFSSATDISSNTTGATIGFFLFRTHWALPLRVMIGGSAASHPHST